MLLKDLFGKVRKGKREFDETISWKICDAGVYAAGSGSFHGRPELSGNR